MNAAHSDKDFPNSKNSWMPLSQPIITQQERSCRYTSLFTQKLQQFATK
ncbi:hypothetical protein [Scytonema sp. PCC 10023]